MQTGGQAVRLRAWTRGGGTLLLALFVLGAPRILKAAEEAPPELGGVTGDPLHFQAISRLEVVGNRTTDESLILKTSGLATGTRAGMYRVRSAVRSLWGLGLFSRIVVSESADSTGGRVLHLEVTENPRITEILWKGNDKLGEEDLKAKIELRAGQILTNKKLSDARRALEVAYQDQGYASATIAAGAETNAENKTSLTFEVAEGKKVKIESVEFEGSHALSEKELRGSVELKKNSLFRRKRYTAERLREAEAKLTDFYHNHGYKDAKCLRSNAAFSEDRSRVALSFVVEEGPAYRFGNVTWNGNQEVPSDALRLASAIRSGAPFSDQKVEQTTSEAYNLYTEKGYLLQLSIVPETLVHGDSVDVAYTVREGEPSHVHEITVLGNTRTKEHVVRRELSLFPGDLLRRSVLMRSHRDVFALGFFEDVGVDYQPTGQGSEIDVVFRVKEKSVGTATAGAGYSSDTGITGFVEFGHNNVFGNGQSVNLHLERGGRRRTYDISFTEPWAFGTPTSLGFQIYNTQRDLDLYTEKRRGFGLNAGRPWFWKFPDYTRVSLAYSLEDVQFTDFIDLSSESEEFLRSSNGTVSSFTSSLIRNSTNNPFYPTGGARTLVRTEWAGGIFGGEIPFYKPTLDHREYFVPFGKPALMLRHRLGYLGTYRRGGRVPGNETFRLGGTRQDYLRGYPDYAVVPEENLHIGADGREVRFPGGRLAYTFTTEYQFLIVNPVHGLFFFDAGNTWNSARDFSLDDLKKGAGVGVRLEIPLLGAVGFDYAYGFDRAKWEPHLIIGPAF